MNSSTHALAEIPFAWSKTFFDKSKAPSSPDLSGFTKIDDLVKSRIFPFIWIPAPRLCGGRLYAGMTIKQLISIRYTIRHTRECGYPGVKTTSYDFAEISWQTVLMTAQRDFRLGNSLCRADPYGRLLNGMMGDIWNFCLAEIEGLDAHARSIEASLLSRAFSSQKTTSFPA